MASNTTVNAPDTPTSESQVKYIIDLAKNGAKLSTEQILALQTALAGTEGLEKTALQKEAAKVLQNSANQVTDVASGNEIARREAETNLGNLAGAGYGADSAAAQQVQDAGRGSTAMDLDTLKAVLAADTQANGENRATAGTYSDLGGAAFDADQANLNKLGAARNTAHNYDAANLRNLDIGAKDANAEDRAALSDLLGSRGAADAADVGNVNELAAANKRVKYIDPSQYGPDVVSKAGGATADADAIAAQKDVLGQYEDLSDPRVTASERYNMELARQQEEQDQRAALGAAMRDLDARGIRSGGAEIGAVLGAGQNTGQTRMLQDMAQLEQSQKRAEAARASRAGLAGDIRSDSFGEQLGAGSAADAVATFNKSQSQAAARAADQLSVQQQQAGFDRSKQVVDTKRDATGDAYDRANQVFDASQGTNATGYGRTADTAKTGLDVTDAEYGRDKGVYDASTGRTDTEWQRAGDVKDTNLGVSKTGTDLVDTLADKSLSVSDAGYGREKDAAGAKVGATQNAVDRYTKAADTTVGDTKQAFQEALGSYDANAQTQNVATGAPANPVSGALSTQLGASVLPSTAKKDDKDLLYQTLGF